MSVTDDERREVARRLRELGKVVYSPDNTYELMADALGVDDFEGTDELFDRLADLIEPGKQNVRCVAEVKIDGEQLEKLAHDAAVELTGIDRDALLALADEMEFDGAGALDDEDWCKPLLVEYARRIREALGVQDA